jgi:hypothetical protein
VNPETTLVWHPLKGRLKDLKVQCLLEGARPPFWDRIENIAGSGFPDLWWAWGTSGTIELKHRNAPPVNAETPCVIESISPEQRLFWRQASEAGSSVHVLTRVGREWFLHEGNWARQWLGVVPIADLRAHSLFTPVDCLDQRCFELPDARTILLICGAVL